MESGFAVAMRMLVVPVILDKTPYGFLHKYRG